MHQDHSDRGLHNLASPDSPFTHHQSRSTHSFSPNIKSNSSISTDGTFETSSPVNESDEIIHPRYYEPMEPEGTLWHDLERDGIDTPAIPSFILNSPPMGPIGPGFNMRKGRGMDAQTHSLRKGYLFSGLS